MREKISAGYEHLKRVAHPSACAFDAMFSPKLPPMLVPRIGKAWPGSVFTVWIHDEKHFLWRHVDVREA
jgi:hypothetical protein